jgi:hypothetical protein
METLFQNVYISGTKQDHIHHGTEHGGVASIRAQLEGTRLLGWVYELFVIEFEFLVLSFEFEFRVLSFEFA